MRSSSLLAACVAGALTGAVPVAFSQTPLPAAPLSADELELAPDEEVVMREYIVRRPPAAVRIERETVLRPGSLVPADLLLESMAADSDPRLRRFGYFISPDDKIVVVNPANRTVVRILDR